MKDPIIQNSLINCKDGGHPTKTMAEEHVSLLLLALSVTKSIVEQKAHQFSLVLQVSETLKY